MVGRRYGPPPVTLQTYVCRFLHSHQSFQTFILVFRSSNKAICDKIFVTKTLYNQTKPLSQEHYTTEIKMSFIFDNPDGMNRSFHLSRAYKSRPHKWEKQFLYLIQYSGYRCLIYSGYPYIHLRAINKISVAVIQLTNFHKFFHRWCWRP